MEMNMNEMADTLADAADMYDRLHKRLMPKLIVGMRNYVRLTTCADCGEDCYIYERDGKQHVWDGLGLKHIRNLKND